MKRDEKTIQVYETSENLYLVTDYGRVFIKPANRVWFRLKLPTERTKILK